VARKFKKAYETMLTLTNSLIVVASLIANVQSFTLNRPLPFRQPTILFSGDAVEKLHLEPIAKIAGEVGNCNASVAYWSFQSLHTSPHPY
jgi:hypothetical protein